MKFSDSLHKFILAVLVLTLAWVGVGILNFSSVQNARAKEKTNTAPIKTSGEIVCLPHKETTGPITLECAFGLKATDGMNYALLDPEMKYVQMLQTGKKVKVEGILRQDTASKYAIAGVIELTSLEK